ncbi:DUF4238 domain-containing protein [Thalassomonas haliotis]|uniref:DUF4238 domain-containing protein n=1 Tax=Thalassomonas haliotis TaxID=485448 RepID=A0ABY7VCL5_9GAMM|nr:DUF4238 domain-containing protein [Thalassomonas haliotis]WDE10869.1 DUF4238 domain-containing protein [Thalassomonas haliotis]
MHTLDKLSQRSYQQSVYDASTRNTFYNIENHPEKYSLEPILGKIEAEASVVIRKIIEEESLASLTDEEKTQLAVFVVIQKSRTFHGLQSIKELINSFGEKLLTMGATQEDLPRLIGSQDESDLKNFFLEMVLKHVNHADQILNKSWLLYKTKSETPYYISDNPVTLHNDVDMGFYGNLGLAVQGIQIHLPISSTLTVAFVCPSHEEKALLARKQLQFIVDNDPSQLIHVKNPKMVVDYANAYTKGTPLETNEENTKFLNSLQVGFAEQYIYCEKKEFALVYEMLKDNESLKTGIRPKMN